MAKKKGNRKTGSRREPAKKKGAGPRRVVPNLLRLSTDADDKKPAPQAEQAKAEAPAQPTGEPVSPLTSLERMLRRGEAREREIARELMEQRSSNRRIRALIHDEVERL